MARPGSRFWADVDRGQWSDVEDDSPVHALPGWNMFHAKPGFQWKRTNQR